MTEQSSVKKPYRTVTKDNRSYLVEPIFDVFGTNGKKLFSVSRDNVQYVEQSWGWSFDCIKTKSGQFRITDFNVIENYQSGTAKIDLFVEPTK